MGRGINILGIKIGGTLVIGTVLGIIMTAVLLAGEAAVSTNEFCTSCHSMTYPQTELNESSHYGALGANPGCKDCHIPQGLGNLHLAIQTHIVDGARELYLEFANDYSTLEKFNERRLIMAHDARMNLKKWNSITCRECHRNPQPPGEDAQAEHKKMETEGATCIDCHQNLVHKAVPETDLNASKSQGKLVLKPEDEEEEDEEDEEGEEEGEEGEEEVVYEMTDEEKVAIADAFLKNYHWRKKTEAAKIAKVEAEAKAEAEEKAEAEADKEYAGLGIEIAMDKNGFLKVISPIEGAPAFKAGIKAGDRIIKLNDTDVKGITVNDAIKIMRGEPNTSITVSVLREGEAKPIIITVARAIIRPKY